MVQESVAQSLVGGSEVADATRASEGLLDREADLERLRSAFGQAVGGGGRLVWVEGEAGIGKTALL